MIVVVGMPKRALFHLEFLSSTDRIAFDTVQSFQLVNGSMVPAGYLRKGLAGFHRHALCPLPSAVPATSGILVISVSVSVLNGFPSAM